MRSVISFHPSLFLGSLQLWVSLSLSPELADFRACPLFVHGGICTWNLHRVFDGDGLVHFAADTRVKGRSCPSHAQTPKDAPQFPEQWQPSDAFP